jgi:hypothetical protein
MEAVHVQNAARLRELVDDPRDGIARPWTLADPDCSNELRASMALKPLGPISPSGPDLPKEVRGG